MLSASRGEGRESVSLQECK